MRRSACCGSVSRTGQTGQRRGRSASAGVSAQAQKLLDLVRELACARERMSAMLEQQQAYNEALKSTNEERQSTNESMATSKEGLQSVNEELITVNAALQSKIEQMALMPDGWKNLLETIRLGMNFLDCRLLIRRFTRDAAIQVYWLVTSDLGRPLTDIRRAVQSGDLMVDTQSMLDTRVPIEREIVTAAGIGYLARLRLYRTVDHVIDGVTMTFADITERVKQIASRQPPGASRQPPGAQAGRGGGGHGAPAADGVGRHVARLSANRTYLASFEGTLASTVGQRFFDIGDGDGAWHLAELNEMLEVCQPVERSFEQAPLQRSLTSAGSRTLRLSAGA
jgi:two-component system CheB/CheR fusion protein